MCIGVTIVASFFMCGLFFVVMLRPSTTSLISSAFVFLHLLLFLCFFSFSPPPLCSLSFVPRSTLLSPLCRILISCMCTHKSRHLLRFESMSSLFDNTLIHVFASSFPIYHVISFFPFLPLSNILLAIHRILTACIRRRAAYVAVRRRPR